MNKIAKYIVLFVVGAAEVTGLVWMRGEYKTTLAEGTVYEMPVKVEDAKNDFESGYIFLDNPIDEAAWAGDSVAEVGEAVRLVIAKDKKTGALNVLHAQRDTPQGDYITVRVTKADDDTIHFDWPADRIYIAGAEKKKQLVEELTRRVPIRDYITDKVVSHLENELMATIRIKDGKTVYEDVKVNGRDVESEQ